MAVWVVLGLDEIFGMSVLSPALQQPPSGAAPYVTSQRCLIQNFICSRLKNGR